MSIGAIERLLLVEDDDIDVMNVEFAFQDAALNAELTVKRNGEEALEWLRGSPSLTKGLLVLLDLNMPRMSGLELLREMRGDDALRRVPVVVLTTSDHERDRIEAYDLAVAGYLLKPLATSDLTAMLVRFRDYWAMNELP